MRTKKDPYQQTIQVYEELGQQYIRDTANASPKEIRQFAGLIRRHGWVLDVGCAGGRDSAFFARRGFRVTGVDVVDEFLRYARRHVPGATFKKMDVRQLRFPKNSFDGIWANAILLHLRKKDVQRVLKKFYDLLKPEGKIHVRVKRGGGRQYGHTRERLVQGKRRLFTYLQPRELEKYFIQAGFHIIHSKIFPDNLGRREVQWIGV